MKPASLFVVWFGALVFSCAGGAAAWVCRDRPDLIWGFFGGAVTVCLFQAGAFFIGPNLGIKPPDAADEAETVFDLPPGTRRR